MQGSKGKDWQALTDDIHSQYNTHLSEENMGRAIRGRSVSRSCCGTPIPSPKTPPPPTNQHSGFTPSFPSIFLHGPASLFCPQHVLYLPFISLPLKFWPWELGGQASHKASSYSTNMRCHVLHSPLTSVGTSIITSPQTWSACHYMVTCGGSTSNMGRLQWWMQVQG